MIFKLYSDGGARGNPGPAGAGWVIYQDGEELLTGGQFLGKQTNNVAEYTALLLGLEKAVELKITKIICHLDSELVVKQLNGEYKVKNSELKKLWQKAKNLAENFAQIEFKHVRREQNKRADQLANLAMDAR